MYQFAGSRCERLMDRPSAPANNQQFDLLGWGGGIYGAWTAYDAALRGLKVILVEQLLSVTVV
jgi:glycerol-3-phosphate dehydrogenase